MKPEINKQGQQSGKEQGKGPTAQWDKSNLNKGQQQTNKPTANTNKQDSNKQGGQHGGMGGQQTHNKGTPTQR